MIQAIETRYKGFRFRSRLEARWAVFYDALGIRWEYEPEGFLLSDGRKYLPDFHLPRQRILGRTEFWIEIKGDEDDDDDRIHAFARDRVEEDSFPVNYLKFTGQIPDPAMLRDNDSWMYEDGATGKGDCGDFPYIWCVCPAGKHFGIQFDGRGERILCECNDANPHHKWYSSTDAKLIRAYQFARSARFEHGESGAG